MGPDLHTILTYLDYVYLYTDFKLFRYQEIS